MKPPDWLVYVFIAVTVLVCGLALHDRYFKDKYRIKIAKDQHRDLTKTAIRMFRERSHIDADYKVVWTDTPCPHHDPSRNIKKGQTSVLYKKPEGTLICLHGLTFSGCDSYVAWRGSIKASALFHEFGHCARLKAKDDDKRSDGAHKDVKWWEWIDSLEPDM